MAMRSGFRSVFSFRFSVTFWKDQTSYNQTGPKGEWGLTRMELDEAIWACHVPMLRLAMSILRHAQNAEDAVSNAVSLAYQKIDTLRDPAALKAWLMKITVRCCYDLLRRRKREVLLAEPGADEAVLFEEPVQDSLYTRLQKLPQPQSQVLVLYYYEGYSTEEISRILGLPRPAVSMRMSRGRARLKAMLEEEERKERAYAESNL